MKGEEFRSLLSISLCHHGGNRLSRSINAILRDGTLLRVVGKLFGRVLIKRVRAGTECAIGEEQCGFRHGRGCQVFTVRQVCEKYLANGKDVFWAFMGLEKAYDTIDRYGMWQMLRVYGVGGKLLKAVQSFHVDSRACGSRGGVVREVVLFER